MRLLSEAIVGCARWGLLGLCLVLVAAAPAARAEEPVAMGAQARAQYDEGMKHYGLRDYAAAARAFAAAHAIEPRREILFAQAQATRLGGDCATAIELYRAFLASDPPRPQVDATHLALTRCQASGAPGGNAPVVPGAGAAPAAPGSVPVPWPAGAPSAGRAPVPSAARAAAPGSSAVPSPVGAGVTAPGGSTPAPPPHSAWWRDRAGLALVAGAAASFGVAAGLAVSARRVETDAGARGIYGGYEERHQVAVGRARFGSYAAALGAGLAAAATGRYLWVGVSERGTVQAAAGWGARF